MKRLPTEALGTIPRATSRSPLRRLLVRSHFSYKRRTSEFEVNADYSMTSHITPTNAGNVSDSSVKTFSERDVALPRQRSVCRTSNLDVVVD